MCRLFMDPKLTPKQDIIPSRKWGGPRIKPFRYRFDVVYVWWPEPSVEGSTTARPGGTTDGGAPGFRVGYASLRVEQARCS